MSCTQATLRNLFLRLGSFPEESNLFYLIPNPNYSSRNATIGSTRAARRAGK
jgi:hypothetical protein